ncbi:DUF2971 domain-containing protein [Methanocella arvoryzae]|uniref:DUF2971 domain-containing protein n=1 Tax=Methanocella arvoryzae (strain DSM 22066 / NBRC 105507 / MRE50) TaxID=351160 RepID=Q0W2T5_METAR|nr:DUF2971 domain-containing protein [Methanocella arvoryzae]CAJ37308.1 hypothetical protein RCIA162 [Methanocella arvoryzae MRE50]
MIAPTDDKKLKQRREKLALKGFNDESIVNCWHMNDSESPTMWNYYSENAQGIAIESNFSRLCDSFVNCPFEVRIGIITYMDYSRESIPVPPNAFDQLLIKRKEFRDERELRAVASYYPQESNGIRKKKLKGKYLPVDLDILINVIHVSPDSQRWFKDLVGSVSVKYGIEKTIKQSKLYGRV